MTDYLKLRLSRTGYMYVLMLVDRMSRFVMFFPTKSVNAADAARAIMVWVNIFGLPS